MLAAIYKIALLAGVIGSQAALPAAAAPKSPEQNEAKAESLSGEGWALWQKRQLPAAQAKFEKAVKLRDTVKELRTKEFLFS
jgi:excinuclease UvrABC helicase subunit UvrB